MLLEPWLGVSKEHGFQVLEKHHLACINAVYDRFEVIIPFMEAAMIPETHRAHISIDKEATVVLKICPGCSSRWWR